MLGRRNGCGQPLVWRRMRPILNNANAGTATAIYTYGGGANHTSSSDSKNFTIDKAASHTVVTCPDSLIYDGSARTPCSVAVTGAGGLSLAPAPNYSHNTDAGTATASYTYDGDANYDGSSDSKDFTIQKAASHTVVTCPASLIYDGSARTPCTVAVTGAGGLNFTPAASYSHNTDAGTATASYTYAGDTNHDGSSDSKNFAINKRNVTASISAADKTYDSTNTATITSCSIETQNSDHGIVSPDAVGCAGSNAHFGNQNAANGKLVTAEVSAHRGSAGQLPADEPDSLDDCEHLDPRCHRPLFGESGKVYDGTDAVIIATCSLDAQSGNHGAIVGDTVGCSGSNGHFNNKNAANGKPVTGEVALTGTAAGNYHLTSATAATTTNITKAPLVLKATDKTMLDQWAGAHAHLHVHRVRRTGRLWLRATSVGAQLATTASGTVAGSFPTTCAAGSLSSNNYSFSFSAGTLMVNYAGSCSGAPIGNPILQPVNNDGSSTFKQGSTVPLKFRACDANGASVGPTTAVLNIVMSFVLDHTTTGTPGVNETVDSTTPDTAFRWSSTDQQWIFNLGTKKPDEQQGVLLQGDPCRRGQLHDHIRTEVRRRKNAVVRSLDVKFAEGVTKSALFHAPRNRQKLHLEAERQAADRSPQHHRGRGEMKSGDRNTHDLRDGGRCPARRPRLQVTVHLSDLHDALDERDDCDRQLDVELGPRRPERQVRNSRRRRRRSPARAEGQGREDRPGHPRS